MLLTPNSTGYPCYHSLIVGELFKKSSLSPYFRISSCWNFVFNLLLLLNLLKNIPSNTGRASAVKNNIVSNYRNYSNCTFPRLTLHACALTHAISLSYRDISLSFHLVTEVFSISYTLFHFPRAISIEQRFFPYIF